MLIEVEVGYNDTSFIAQEYKVRSKFIVLIKPDIESVAITVNE